MNKLKNNYSSIAIGSGDASFLIERVTAINTIINSTEDISKLGITASDFLALYNQLQEQIDAITDLIDDPLS
jgi:hypothetical protein